MGRGFNMLVRMLAVPGIQDTQCGFKAFTSAAPASCSPGQTHRRLRLRRRDSLPGPSARLRIVEVPITWRYARRPAGSTRSATPLRMVADVVRVRWNDLRGCYADQQRASG